MNTEGVSKIKKESTMNTKAAQRHSGVNNKDKGTGLNIKEFRKENVRVS